MGTRNVLRALIAVILVAAFGLPTGAPALAASPASSAAAGAHSTLAAQASHPRSIALQSSRRAPRLAPQESLTVIKAGAGSGTVTSNPAGIDCGATCTASFDVG